MSVYNGSSFSVNLVSHIVSVCLLYVLLKSFCVWSLVTILLAGDARIFQIGTACPQPKACVTWLPFSLPAIRSRSYVEAQSSNVQVYRERCYFGSRAITRACSCPCLRTPGLRQRYQSCMCSESSCLCLWGAQPPWCHLLEEMARRTEGIRDCCSIRDIWHTIH